MLQNKKLCVVAVVLLAVILIAPALPCSAQIFSDLKTKIQAELDENPFLQKEGIKIIVADEQNGYVTIEMVEGDRTIRASIHGGNDIMDPYFKGASTEGEKKTVSVIKRTVDQVSKINGVKQVLVTAQIDTQVDRGTDYLKKGIDAERAQDYNKAFEWYQKAAELGNARGQACLGLMYELGRSVKQDYAKALELHIKSAEQGDGAGQWGLGCMYYLGRGVAQDYAKAFEWYMKAAEGGNDAAQVSLAGMYERGEGVPQDFAKAFGWYRKAADQGNALAQYNVGRAYERGNLGVVENLAEAVGWYMKAAEQGLDLAQCRLGLLYEYGVGVPKDCSQAIGLYRKAAAQGNGLAQFDLGHAYEKGISVPKDYAQAIKWYQEAAEQDIACAQDALAWIYATCPNAEFLDSKKALLYARQATSKENTYFYIRTLAAAYARDGDFDKAVELLGKMPISKLREAIVTKTVNQNETERLKKMLDLYRSRTAYVDDEE